MSLLHQFQSNKNSLGDALTSTRRELGDSMRDWRIVLPIFILTVIFPWIMNLSTQLGMLFVQEYDAQILPLRLMPFAMMIVGFFPISFSLIIALEAFVGEKERNSLEPLLTTPVSDAALYMGKLVAAMLLPLTASYIGVGSFLAWSYLTIQYVPDGRVLAQILLLTTMEALVMVAGAVVVSSHTTTVRAANLLASFIIIPMAFLLQGESVLLFWGEYDVLWYVIGALAVADLLLIRTGIRTFNREEILARDIDELNLISAWRMFRRFWGSSSSLSPTRIYRVDVPRLLRENRGAILVTTLVILGGVAFGWAFAEKYPIPRGMLGPLHVAPEAFKQEAVQVGGYLLPSIDTMSIFSNNVRSLMLAALLGLFSFGSLDLLLLLVPMGLVGFIAGEMSSLGQDPFTFFMAFIVPHGLFELPAAILASAFALRLGASIIAPPAGVTAGENMVHALADLTKVFVFVVVPLLLIAAMVEANVTPQIVLWLYGS